MSARRIATFIALCGTGWPVEAFASGGAHVVDDATVEVAGTCHLESWVSRTTPGDGLVNTAPACTFRALPMIEWGGAVQRDRARGSRPTTLAGPAIKLRLIDPARGPGLALAMSAAVDTRDGSTRAVSIFAPVSVGVGHATRANINLGWARDGRHQHALIGAQIEHDPITNVTLMAEAYRLPTATGAQAGVRWNPRGGRVDLDLLAARDTGRPVRLTLGLTIRR